MSSSLIVRYEFDAAHRLPLHEGKCRNLHGHRYVVEVTVEAGAWGLVEKGPSTGMVVDAGDLKKVFKGFIDETLDHGTVLCDSATNLNLVRVLQAEGNKLVLLPFEPTAENLSVWLKGRFALDLDRYLRKEKLHEYTRPARGPALGEEIPKVTRVELWETPNCRARA